MVAHALVPSWSPRPEPAPPLHILVSRRRTSAPRLGAFLESCALVHTHFRLDLSRHRNVTDDERLLAPVFERKGHLDRPQLLLVLEGRARVEQGLHRWSLQAGDVLWLATRRGTLVRHDGPRYASAAIEWDPGTLGGPVRSCAAEALGPADLARARAIVDAIAAGPSPGDACVRFAELVAVLRDLGAPLRARRPGDFAEDVEPATVALSRALDDSLSDLGRRPMVVDLEQALGVSTRHLQRLVAAFHARYGFDAGGWRDALNRRRLRVGAAFMTAPGAGTEIVAGAVGYGSSAALCRAFAESRLPSPTAVPRVVCGLG